MKYKKLLFVLISIFLFTNVVSAKSCTVVSGTGKDIGDEIVCGTEHFYVLENNDSTVKMLAKYNLYVGNKIEKDSENFNVESYGDDYLAYLAADEHCNLLRETYGEENVETTAKYSSIGVATDYFCRVYTPLEYEKVKQDKLAIGLYPSGNMEIEYPIYGSIDLDEEVGEKEFDENFDMIPETSQFNTYLDGYKNTLKSLGLNIINIGFIKKSGLENTINSVSNKTLSIPTYTPSNAPEDSIWEMDPYINYDLYIYKFNIKEYVPEKYNWLYGTSYWIGSATHYQGDGWEDYYDEFLSTVGDYCSYGRGCHYSKMGVGLRPVIEINSSEISIKNNSNNEIPNPKTIDNIYIYLICEMVSLIGIVSSIYCLKNK